MKGQEVFKIYPKNDLFEMAEAENATLIDQIDYNKAYVMGFPDNKRIAVIAAKGAYGVLFHDKKTFDEMVASKTFPVTNETDTFFEKDKLLIGNIDVNIGKFLEEFNKNLDLTFDWSKNIGQEEMLLISKKINLERIRKNKLIERNKYLLGYLLQHLLIKYFPNRLEWHMDTQFTLNVYWIPVLREKGTNKYFSFWRKIEEQIKQEKKLDIIKLLRWEMARLLDFEFMSKDFGAFIDGKIPLPEMND